ncbi:hypothetical protein K450DRAFT_251103 [Umbelopsis ramanniana AG]|uniref:SCD domain-containing protein n=1 Tax=Umbelopsis ramanniana AG TaxID=1314678 RepID=A0AAD5HCK5_UMBRA|nr:uncharacterized protein K450DRAFT_251103 [Umbelopsis ramanniana AG]KAI8577651.1 hypothetical protein K450DRAFT_251103 [Umbelopsis ramanniana AG]
MGTALKENVLRRSRRQPASQQKATTEKNVEKSTPTSDNESESEVDELMDTDNSSSSDSEGGVRAGNVRTTIENKQRKKRLAKTTLPESPSDGFQELDEEDDIHSLYGQLLAHNLTLDNVIEEWIEKYKGPEKMDAVHDLINFITRSCGTKEKVDPKAIEDDDYIVEALQNLEKKIASDRYTEYPIASKLRVFKTLKTDLIAFWKKLIEECQYDIIYDGLLIETLQAWLATMSSSTFRPFRHTATMIALNLISALSAVANRAVQEKKIANRQLGAERRKTSNGNATERLKMLQEKSKTLANKEVRLNGYIKHYFDSVFVHRCRDVEAIIRTECIKHLGEWMEQYPSYFLDNNYLRYIGWLLNDKSSNVRAESIKGIIALYEREANATTMEPFMQRFKTRMMEMALYEVDQPIRIQAIRLCVSLAENSILEPNECAELGTLVFSDLPKVRNAITPLIHLTLENNYVNPKLEEAKAKAATLPPARTAGGRTRGVASEPVVDKNAIEFKCLATILLEYSKASQVVKKPKNNTEADDSESVDNGMELDTRSDPIQQSSDKINIDPLSKGVSNDEDSRIAQAITSLAPAIPILREWKALVDFLLKDYSSAASSEPDAINNLQQYYQLTDDEEYVLIEALIAVVTLCVEPSAERRSKSKKKTTADEETKNNVSRYIAQMLTRLMSKYAADANIIAKILILPQLISLSAYTDLRMPKAYEQLLEDVKKMFVRHTTSQVHLNAALAIKRLTSFESMASATEASLNEFRDELAILFKRTFAEKDLQATKFSENDIHTFTIALSRYQRIIEVMDITDMFEENFSKDTLNIQVVLLLLERGKLGHPEETVMVVSAATILFQYLAWKSYQVLADTSSVPLSRLIAIRNDVIHTLTDLALNNELSQAVDSIRRLSFQMFVDLHWLFSNEQFKIIRSADGSSLMLRSAPNVQVSASQYVEQELDRWGQNYSTQDNEDDSDDDETRENNEQSSSPLSDPKKQYELLTPVAAFAKAILLGIFDTHLAVKVIKRYRSLGPELDEAIKAMIFSIKDNLNTVPDSKVAQDTLSMYFDALKEPQLDKPLQLARLLAGSIKAADSDPFHKTSPDHLTDKIHIAGVTYCLSKAGGYSKINDQESKATCLKFFKLLTVFSPLLTRARDVAKIRRQIDSLMEEHGLTVEADGKEWDTYTAYLSSIDTVLQKKGLRYDSSNKVNTGSNQRHLIDVDQNLPEEIERLQPQVVDVDDGSGEDSDDERLQRKSKASKLSQRGTKRKADTSSKQDAKQIRLSRMVEK